MIARNPRIAHLEAGYLFPEIARRRRAFEAAHPAAGPEDRVLSLGIGNTTEPILPLTGAGLTEGARCLATPEGYTGYGDEQGLPVLREKIAEVWYHGAVQADEVFVSDGAKCDIGRLQLLFGQEVPVTVQDPSYPVYVDGSVLAGAAGAWAGAGYQGITYLPCTAENGFFPDLTPLPQGAVLYFCSPNNPTGAACTRPQLQRLVDTALRRQALIVFDAAYAAFIRDPQLPRSIYEITDAASCAIEVNSFSKPAGFTGVRLGWTVVPRALKYRDGKSIHTDWLRIVTTIFNGASNIAQAGGLAALSEGGLGEIRALTDYYLRNASLILQTLKGLGIPCVGGDNSPYVWARFAGRDSWEVFGEILEKCRVVTTPGAGFGPAGQGFIRFSAFGHQKDIEEACRRLGERL
ncbi:MAG: LL-diaminopimelate aminotransferase [Treponema sp.]|jgi:LL-diaminopimelate aminotransferase|nr:LL-diaminopimelate aminotransferase [Treponema sp.]